MQKITPCLWFNGNAEEAVNFYTSLFKDAKIIHTTRYGDAVAAASGMPKDSVLAITFQLFGQEYLALNGGPQYSFTQAISFMVNCDSQEEVDYFWEKLTAGGQEIQCGWLKDKFGLTWQVVPTMLIKMMNGPHPAKYDKALMALGPMKKPDIATLKKAYEEG